MLLPTKILQHITLIITIILTFLIYYITITNFYIKKNKINKNKYKKITLYYNKIKY